MQVKCQGCGKTFSKPQCRIDQSNYVFCSSECRKNKCIPVTCTVCNNQFLADAHSYRTAKFCTDKCRNTSKRNDWNNGKRSIQATKRCKECNKEFAIKNSLVEKQDYCSLACFHKTGKISPKHGEANHKWKPKVKIVCEYCGKEFETFPSRKDRKKYCCASHRIVGNLMRLSTNPRTNIEKKMYEMLNSNRIKFTEQTVMFDKFMVDFFIEQHKIIIQCDGVYWHERKKTKDRDRGQDAYLAKAGYIVIRFTDNQILEHPDSCLSIIKSTIKTNQIPLINW